MADALPGAWPATIVEIETQTRCRRVRARVEGLFDETPYWCQPAGLPGAGGLNQGSQYPLTLGQQIYLFFLHGDPNAGAIYLTGPYGIDQATGLMPGPQTLNDATVTVEDANKDVIIWEDETFLIGVLYSKDRKQIRLVEKETSTGIVIDAADGAAKMTKSVLIQATTAIRISCVGLLNIFSRILQLQDRRVLRLTKKTI